MLPKGYKTVLDWFQEVVAAGDEYENPEVVIIKDVQEHESSVETAKDGETNQKEFEEDFEGQDTKSEETSFEELKQEDLKQEEIAEDFKQENLMQEDVEEDLEDKMDPLSSDNTQSVEQSLQNGEPAQWTWHASLSQLTSVLENLKFEGGDKDDGAFLTEQQEPEAAIVNGLRFDGEEIKGEEVSREKLKEVPIKDLAVKQEDLEKGDFKELKREDLKQEDLDYDEETIRDLIRSGYLSEAKSAPCKQGQEEAKAAAPKLKSKHDETENEVIKDINDDEELEVAGMEEEKAEEDDEEEPPMTQAEQVEAALVNALQSAALGDGALQ
jgi:hypothetical protein